MSIASGRVFESRARISSRESPVCCDKVANTPGPIAFSRSEGAIGLFGPWPGSSISLGQPSSNSGLAAWRTAWHSAYLRRSRSRLFGGRRGPARAERDMVLFLTRTKRNVRRTGEILIWIVLMSLILGPWIAWLIGEPYRHHIVREGELCVPGQRWTYAQPKFADSDLSCEPE